MQLLVDKGAKVDLVDAHGCTALTCASRSNFDPAVTLLLAVRTSVVALSLVNKNGKTALDYADEGGEARESVEKLAPVAATIRARGGLMGFEAKALMPPAEQLLWACIDRRAEDALRLISEGADVDFAGQYGGDTPLIMASVCGLEAVVARLVEVHAKLDLVSAYGVSALTAASVIGHTRIVQLLADKGARLDLVDKLGRSALFAATNYGHHATAQLLVDRMDAAALNLVNAEGETALDHADWGGEVGKFTKELAPVAAAIRARGGLTGSELAARV